MYEYERDELLENPIFIRPGKKGGLVSFTNTGKLIIVQNKGVHTGYARVKSFSEKERYILATVENVAYDFYYGISYKEFKRVLSHWGYKLEYSEPIDEIDTFYVYANLHTGSLVTVETWGKNGEEEFNSINIWVNTHRNINYFCRGFSMSKYPLVVFSALTYGKGAFSAFTPLNDCSCDWGGETPSLWHYGDSDRMGDEFNSVDYEKAAKKIYKFKDNIDKLFNIRTSEYLEILKRW